MKKIVLLLLAGAFLLSSCSKSADDTETSNPGSFRVALKGHVNEESKVSASGKTEWTFYNPYYSAQFSEKSGAKSYSIAIVAKNGDVGAAKNYPLSALDISGGQVHYKVGVGSLRVLITDNIAQAEAERKRQLDYLSEVGHQAIEVTPVY